MGLIVDTSVFVKIERGGGSLSNIFRRYGSDQKFGVSAMTIAELQHGVSRADGNRRRQDRKQF